MAVFYKQGLKERINVCLFALSLADQLHLINNMLMYGEQIHVRFTTKEIYGPLMRFLINHYLLGFYGFTWVSQVISAIIASEKCFCIMYPLRSQNVLKTSTMTVVVVIVNVVIVGLFSMAATRYRTSCAIDPLSHQTIIIIVSSEFYFRHQQLIDYLEGVVLGAGLSGLVTLVMLITTTITMIKLRQAAAWRAGTSSICNSVLQREIALTKMLVSNSIFFIVCTFPYAVFKLIFLAIPSMGAGQRHHNFYFMIMWVLNIFSSVNSTFNILIYYTMGSRFRRTFWQIFSRNRKK